MRRLFLQLAAVVLVFSACQKEKSLEDPNATPGTPATGNPGNRLVRTGTRLGTDTVTIDYTYNSANLLTGITFTGMSQGAPFNMQQRINRNQANVITSIVVKSPLLPALNFGRDSLVTQVFYDGASGRYMRTLSSFIWDDEPLTDSTVFDYNNVGKLSAAVVHLRDDVSPYIPFYKTEYAFAENNLVERKFYVIGGTSFELEEIATFKHDGKVNPLPISSEAQLLMFSNIYPIPFNFWLHLGLNDFFSVNNITDMKVTTVSTSETEETAATYTYNNRNLPETCIRTFDSIPFAITRYFYQ